MMNVGRKTEAHGIHRVNCFLCYCQGTVIRRLWIDVCRFSVISNPFRRISLRQHHSRFGRYTHVFCGFFLTVLWDFGYILRMKFTNINTRLKVFSSCSVVNWGWYKVDGLKRLMKFIVFPSQAPITQCHMRYNLRFDFVHNCATKQKGRLLEIPISSGHLCESEWLKT